MLQYMFLPFRRYAEFSGRSRRMEYWSFTLLNILVMLLILVVAMVFGFSFGAFRQIEAGGDPSELFGTGFYLLFGLASLYLLIVFIPSIAVTVRRFHDRDMSGWWVLGFMVLSAIPLIGFIASLAQIVIMFLPGTPGPNRFGDDPKDPEGMAIFA